MTVRPACLYIVHRFARRTRQLGGEEKMPLCSPLVTFADSNDGDFSVT